MSVCLRVFRVCKYVYECMGVHAHVLEMDYTVEEW